MVLGIDFPGIWCKTKEGTNNEEIAIRKRLEKVVNTPQIWSFVLIPPPQDDEIPSLPRVRVVKLDDRHAIGITSGE